MSDCQSCNFTNNTLNLKDADCGVINENPIDQIGNCVVDSEGRPIQDNTSNSGGQSCVVTPSGIVCPKSNLCTGFDLSTGPESCLISSVIEEALNIGGADINVYKMLGVHEQGSINDLTGTGAAIASSFYQIIHLLMHLMHILQNGDHKK
jgi:hypothetical protein